MVARFIILTLIATTCFVAGRYRGGSSELQPVDVNLGQLEGHIASFGDFDSDRFTDVFVIGPNKQNITAHLWDGDSKFLLNDAATVLSAGDVLNIITADFNLDGSLDMLVQAKYPDDATRSTLTLHYGNYNKFASVLELGNDATVGHVSIIDWNGDLLPDLIGTLHVNGSKTIWVNSGKNFTTIDLPGSALPFAEPHSNAIVDINGDCAADLMLTLQNDDSLEYHLYLNVEGKFSPPAPNSPLVYKTPLTAGLASFADFDGDGNMDVAFTVCNGSKCEDGMELHIVYNQQEGVCKNAFDSSSCKSQTKLCQAGNAWRYPSWNGPAGAGHVIINNFPAGLSFYADEEFPGVTLRVGDYDLDSYPDLLIPFFNEKLQTSQVQLWRNVECEGTCPGTSDRRRFNQIAQNVNALTDIKGAFIGAWFDLEEQAVNSMFVLSRETALSNVKISAVLNNIFADASFIKTTGLNGVCTGWCSSGDKFPSPKPYGVNKYGATFKLTWNDLGGTQHAIVAPQLSQSGYLALQTPYVLNGIGRVSSYVEYLYYGIPVAQSEQVGSWTGVLPNSQVVTIPYAPSKPKEWTLELYIDPSASLIFIGLALILAMIGIGAIILYLMWRERKQDENEKKEMEHLFSFKAL